MAKHHKSKDHSLNDDLDDKTIQDQVNQFFKRHPKDYFSKLEEIGFVYRDDENDQEEQEEVAAKPLNENQEYLVSFFDGEIPLSNETFEIFLEERRCSNPNFPLFRRYFKSGNKNLLFMILYGLHHFPVSAELLSDSAYSHEYKGILQIVINHYMTACENQENLETFSNLVMEFYYATAPDEYQALYALKEKFPIGTDKRKIIDFLNEIEDAGVNEEDNEF
ncbi:MAG: hypothetical protein P4L69_18995 [Desulfosporosinus sp.]|nr:hypothetical protein [Desulfosporosinus sp.]